MKNNKIIKYLVDSYQELKKVSWPPRKQLIRDTLIVIVSAVVVSLVVAAIDLGLTSALEYFISLKG